MAANELNNPVFQDAEKARQWLENRLWADGPVCPFCGTVANATAIPTRPGLYQCNEGPCRKQFTVTVGTVFERSHIPLNKWLMAAFLICSSKKGVSALQMSRMLGVSYKSTWFMMHRIREAMRVLKPGPLGGEGKIVESDETFVGGKSRNRAFRRPAKKVAVLTLIERGNQARSFQIKNVNAKTIRAAIMKNVDRKSTLMTDEWRAYINMGREFANHETVKHASDEYVRDDIYHVNSAENFFSIFKRGVTGVYHHVSEQHLKRYLAEFDFRYNNRKALGVDDRTRADKLLRGIVGKRLTYRPTNEAGHG
ncbi:MAG: IS1595 family transposase [Rhodospirillales bacterium]